MDGQLDKWMVYSHSDSNDDTSVFRTNKDKMPCIALNSLICKELHLL